MSATPAHRVRALTAAAMAGAGRAVQPAASPAEADAPTARRRWALTPRAAVAAGVVLLVVAGLAVGRSALARSAPEPVPVPVATVELPEEVPEVSVDPGPPEASAGPGGAAAAGEGGAGEGVAADPAGAGAAAGVVVVHVAGEVGRPGVVEVPSGSRLEDAIEAAGGATGEADLAAVNLARPVVDGEQVYVPSTADERAPASWGGGTTGAGGSDGAGSGLVDLNAADVGALDALPGIGPVLAQRILDWRTEHGRFTSVDELGEVAGIGPTVLERLRPLVVV